MSIAEPRMLVEEFEEIERAVPETVWLEFIDQRMTVKPPQDGNHAEMVMWLIKRCLKQHPGGHLYPSRGLRTGTGRGDRVRPDGVLAPRRHFAGDSEWSDPSGVLMVADVVPHGMEKLHSYAAAGIPVCLLLDRDDHSVSVQTRPESCRYRYRMTVPFGDVVHLPEPVGISLETEGIKGYVR